MTTATINTRPFPTPFVLPPIGARREGTAAPQRVATPSQETDEAVDAPGTPAILFGAIAGGYVVAFTAGWLAFVPAVALL
jgi:hypothetical protein